MKLNNSNLIKNLNVSNTLLLSLAIASIMLAILIGTIASTALHRIIIDELKNSEISNTLNAIKTGPLVLARLHAGSISNDFLTQLMESKSSTHNLFIHAKITGGPNNTFVYSTWSAPPTNIPEDCQRKKVEQLNFNDALNPFYITLEMNDCYRLQTETKLLLITIASILITVIGAIILLFLASLPLIHSLRNAELIIKNQFASEMQIPYIPIKNLVTLAKKSLQIEADAAFAKLATQVAHDIRSPLSALNIATSTLTQIPNENRQLIFSSVERINEIATDLLTKAKSKMNKQHPNSDKISLLKIVKSIIEEKRVQVIDTNINIRLISDPEGPTHPTLNVPKTEISRVISNLINNAIESLPEGGGSVDLTIKNKSNGIELIVTDTGRGIDPEALAILQAGEFGNSYGKLGTDTGFGLGLKHAQQTIGSIGGTIDINSKQNLGTTIRLFLPLKI